MTGNEARRKFLDYFAEHDHRIVRSSSLVPQADPTLLFVNAGMVQFKRIFIGEEKRDYNRAATSQKCVRAGGKHNDLDNVGYTARHHTFFEMLGNFSFGDYFKEKAIALAWDLLLNGYGLEADHLWVSIYQDDDEAFAVWRDQIGVPEERIVRLGEKDNFWSMGDTGPCGPCSEIHIDRGQAFGCGQPTCQVGCECDRFLEIWNMVFMQYNRDAEGQLTPLPQPSIDTGMGLERITAVMQNARSNYETDLFLPIIATLENAAQTAYGQNEQTDICLKVIADHIRAAVFLIGDGVLPANDGRGYVLRRIMRRAIRYGRNLGLTRPFLHQAAATVFDLMSEPYPELKDARAFISNVIENEEMRFSETLDNGLRLLQETLAELEAAGRTVIPGEVIFKLYDTYGFPVDIVQDVVRQSDFTLDMAGFQAAMDNQRRQSRSVSDFSQTNAAYRSLSEQGLTTTFVGYETLTETAEVLALVQAEETVSAATEGDVVEVVAEKTPFYGESGGQVGDTGVIAGDRGKMVVDQTVKDPTGMTIHKGHLVSGALEKGEIVRFEVDPVARGATALNHTATHLLHAALRAVVGDHVKQAGSLVSPERLRFDFTHFSLITPDQVEEIERFVNQAIRDNWPVAITEQSLDSALQDGVTALFEEKYADTVRVITIGSVSRELCGGTHTARTGDIGLFKIVSEASVASGMRRIEALTGAGALAHVQENLRRLQETAAVVKEAPAQIVERVEKMVKTSKALEKEVEQLKTKLAAATLNAPADGGGEAQRTINGLKVLARTVAADNPAALRDLADQLKDKLQSGIVVLGAAAPPKAFLLVAVTKDLTDRFKAGDIIKEAAAVIGGGGGGRPDLAQAGGSQPEKIEAAVERACEIIETLSAG